MKDFSRRLAVSAVSVALVVILLLFAYQSVFQYVVALVVALLAATAMWEYGQFARAKGGQLRISFLLLFTILEVLAFFTTAKVPGAHIAPLVVFFVSVLIAFALHFRQQNGAIVDIAISSFGLLYIAVPLGMFLSILYLFPAGRVWALYLLIVTKITDIGAYFGGNLWGHRKLAPLISPGKTVEGALFGLVLALLASDLFYLFGPSDWFALHNGRWILFGFILGVVGQFGDLAESLLKRDANKKDSNALPGLGGVLDSLDSLLFTIPIIYFFGG